MSKLTVIDGSGGDKDIPQYIAKISYVDREEEDLIYCTLMGVSNDLKNFIVFHDAESLERGAPKCVVRESTVRKVVLLGLEEIADVRDQEL